MTSKIWRVFVLALVAAAPQPAIAEDTIRVRIENQYVARLELGFLGNGKRAGTDILDGTLTLQPDGITWKGVVDATIDMTQEMKGLGKECPWAHVKASQRLHLEAVKVTGGLSGPHTITYRSGRADAGFLALEVTPAAAPKFSQTGPCIDMYQRGPNDIPLLPLNDARWTQPPKYVIGLPQSGVLAYDDQPHSDHALGESHWKIRVERL